jgi:membrane protease YdiL (CAAX protease family)
LIPFGVTTNMALAVGTLLPVLMHPAEIFAAAVWFSLVTWLMLKTRSIWDCILAHAVTNLLIGLWVLYSGDWFLM